VTSLSIDRDTLLNREDAASMLRLTPQTLANWASTGKGPPVVRLGRAVRYRVSDLTRWIERNTTGGDSER
jgi:predicted DNA-binding transcriptional regulator AlpA